MTESRWNKLATVELGATNVTRHFVAGLILPPLYYFSVVKIVSHLNKLIPSAWFEVIQTVEKTITNGGQQEFGVRETADSPGDLRTAVLPHQEAINDPNCNNIGV
jgi:hypothetical protein